MMESKSLNESPSNSAETAPELELDQLKSEMRRLNLYSTLQEYKDGTTALCVSVGIGGIYLLFENRKMIQAEMLALENGVKLTKIPPDQILPILEKLARTQSKQTIPGFIEQFSKLISNNMGNE